MEYTFFISDPINLKLFYSYKNYKFTRIYFGNEFCDKFLPSIKQIRNVLSFCRKNKVNFSFVTPYCTDSTLKKIYPLLSILPEKTEVILNDFALLEIIKKKNLISILGRLLVSISKDPRISFDSKYNFYLKSNNLHRSYLKFLLNNGISRIELDNVMQGYNINIDDKISLSLYYPFVCCSITRKCIFANQSQLNKKFKVIVQCNYECLNKTFRYNIKGCRRPLYIMGNVQYYVNKNKTIIYEKKINRLVYMPKFPNRNLFKLKRII